MSENSNGNRQILVIKDDEETTPSKWSIKKYGQSIKKFKWWVTGFTLGLALVAFIGVQYVYNPSVAKFESQFSYNLPITIDETTGNGTYIDGSAFNYYDIVSEDNLAVVKASSDEFASLDVERIAKNKKIAIAVNGRTDSKTEEFVITLPVTYTISGDLKSFGDASTAKNFVKGLVELTKTKAISVVNSYALGSHIPADAIFDNLDFDRQISVMSSEYSRVLSTYDTLLSSYGEDVRVQTGDIDESLFDARWNCYYTYYLDGESVFAVLSNRLKSRNYMNYDVNDPQKSITALEELGAGYIKSIKENVETIKIVQDALDNFVTGDGTTYGDNATQQKIAEYNQRILDLQLSNQTNVRELKELGYNVGNLSDITLDNVDDITTEGGDGKIQRLQAVVNNTEEGKTWAKENAAFKASILDYKDKLVDDADKCTQVARFVYGNKLDKITYTYSGIIYTYGGFSAWIGLAIGLLVGFVATSLICCSIYVSEDDKDEVVAQID